jgi:hypothetical protein
MHVKLIDLVRRFDSGEILLPLMQRDYVWRPAKVVKLLDSLYKRWPIGCFYVWHTRHEQSPKTKVGEGARVHHSMDGFYGFLLDGQQRLTSLSLAISGDAQAPLASRAFFDLVQERFLLGEATRTVKKRINRGDPTLVALSDLIPGRQLEPRELETHIGKVVEGLKDEGLLDASGRAEAEFRERLRRVADLLDTDALCEEFKNDQVENAIELFARLNKGGTSLSAGDVEAARLSQEATAHIVPRMREFVGREPFPSLGFNFVFVTRSLVTLRRGTSRFADLPRNWATGDMDIAETWKATEKGLAAAAELVRNELGWTSRRWLPSANALIPVAFMFLGKEGKLRVEEKQCLKSYLLRTGLRGLFRGSVETAINTYVNVLRKAHPNVKNRAALLVKRIPQTHLYKVRPEDIKKTAGMYAPLMQVYLAYLVSKNAASWMSGRPLLKVALGDVPDDPLAVHHIFPKAFMRDLEVPPERLNTMANYAILAQSDNAELAEQDPADAFRHLSPQQRQMAAKQLGFHVSDERLDPKAYDEFVDRRAQWLATELNEFLDF